MTNWSRDDSLGTDSKTLQQHLLDTAIGQGVGVFVAGVAVVAADPAPVDLVLVLVPVDQFIEALP